MNESGAIKKIKISLFMMIFLFALAITNVRPNLNHLTAEQIANDIHGIGKIKSERIVKERETKGKFKSKDDFYVRVVDNKEYRIGDTVYERIVKTYKIGE